MTLNYSKEDDAALANAWFPEATRPFVYQVKRSSLFGGGYMVVKSFQDSFSVEMSHDSGLTQEQAIELLVRAQASGNVEKFFITRRDEAFAAARAEYAAEQRRREEEAQEYLRTRKPLTWIIDEIEAAK